MTRATIDDVAKLAGVSIKTVSRVVNREPNVRDSTRETVEAAIAQLNYQPNLSARSLASQKSHLIALVYDDPSAYNVPSFGYVIRMQQGMLQACRTANYGLLIHPCNYRNKDVGTELKELIEKTRPDGIVLAAPLSNMPRIVKAITATGTPLVRLSPGQLNGNALSVMTNDREVCAEMARYLASLGHTRIAFIKGDPKHKAVAQRFIGFKEGLEQCGLEMSEELVVTGDNSIDSGDRAAEELLSLDEPPTAIFAANDEMAAGVIRVAYRKKISVPTELSVAGFDDSALSQQIFPSLTTIRQPLAAMAERAATALINDPGNGSSLHGTDIVPATLISRESTARVPRR